MLVEADSGDEAIDCVKSEITYSETPYPAWSDWHEVGGRWEGLFAGWEETRNALCYAENPTLAEDIIHDFANQRVKELNRLYEQLVKEGLDIEKMISEYSPHKYDYAKSMSAWSLTRLGKLLSNDWNSDTGVYDLKEHSANIEHFWKRVQDTPNTQFLVPVDFHF